MLFPCTDIGERPKAEFRWGGYLKDKDDANGQPEWAQHLWLSEPRGLMFEWWYHTPSARWYIGQRDVASEIFVSLEPAEMALQRIRSGADQ